MTEHERRDVCASCRWWQQTADDQGECRKNAPPPLLNSPSLKNEWRAAWPLTMASDWCGQWAPQWVRQGKATV